MEERKCNRNILENKAAKLAMMSFILKEDAISVHIRMGNMTALSYFMKMGEGVKKPGVSCHQERNLAIPFEIKDHDYC